MSCIIQISSSHPVYIKDVLQSNAAYSANIVPPGLLKEVKGSDDASAYRSAAAKEPSALLVEAQQAPAMPSGDTSVRADVDPQLEQLANEMTGLSGRLNEVKKDGINLCGLVANMGLIVNFALAHANEAHKHYTQQQIDHLSNLITQVEKFVRKYSRRGWFGRFFHRKSDRKTVSAAENQLDELCRMDPRHTSRCSNPFVISISISQWDSGR
ncbi:hypothetical protein BDN72DRAFT_841362 [Pluteus cervinus]|uniref:Uncharacterized protein n=1 Tax=Pluteus cervinus TaxID=181527 RepID=A0ACD3ATF0_9AGAR|nr:hypothetical protein BDN72DRAFT_841362 [Pluteus cervinus]